MKMHWNMAFLKSPFGILNLLAVIIALVALFACSLRWNSNGDVYIQLVYANYTLQTVILAALIIILVISTLILLSQLMSCPTTLSLLRKSGVFGAFVICLLLSLLVCGIEVWYALEYDIENRIARSRVIIVMIMAVILSIILTVLLIIVGLYHRNTSAQVTTITVRENRTAPCKNCRVTACCEVSPNGRQTFLDSEVQQDLRRRIAEASNTSAL